MKTKAEERRDLAMLEKFIGTLDADGYVACALKGVVEDAKLNIENDWALNRYDAWQEAEQRADMAEAYRREQEKRADEAERAAIACADKLVEVGNELNELKRRAEEDRKEVHILTADGQKTYGPFAKITFHNNDGFMFINVEEKSGWVTSYKVEDLKEFVIK